MPLEKYMNKILFNRMLLLLVLGAVWALPGVALSSEADTTASEAANRGESSHLGGPTSVSGTLKTDREAEAALALPEGLFGAYFDFKKRVEKDYGLAFGFDYNALYQAATGSLGKDSAASGALRMFGRWTLTGRDLENTGTFVYKFENRHRLGTDIAPQDLGPETGYNGLTAVPFSSAGWILTNFFWHQQLLDRRVSFVAGVVDTTDYVDVYGLVDPWTCFNNLAFSTNPTIPAPNQGLGIAAGIMVTDSFYAVGGIADANGDPGEPGLVFDSFFSKAEYFTHIEAGWIASFDRRFSDNIHLTAWHADEREDAGVPDGWGVAFSFGRLIADTWEPFVRAGYAEDGGALWDRSVSVGLGYHAHKKGGVLGFGLNWSRPNEDTLGSGLDDQYTAEAYYRFQVLKVLAVTPDVQLLINPAFNQDEDTIAVFGIRARISL